MAVHSHDSVVANTPAGRRIENSIAYLLPRLREGMSLLDVGCGPGDITVALAERVAPGRVEGVDTSEEALQVARELAAGRGADVQFTLGDAYALDEESGAFDVVHAHLMLHHLERPVEAIREFGRVAGREGLVALREFDFGGTLWFPEVPALDEWLDLFLRIRRMVDGDPAAGRKLLGWAQQAGLSDIEPSASVWLFATAEDRSWYADRWAQRAMEGDFAQLALEHGLASREDLVRIAEAWRTWAAAPDGWMVIPHAEIIARGISG